MKLEYLKDVACVMLSPFTLIPLNKIQLKICGKPLKLMFMEAHYAA